MKECDMNIMQEKVSGEYLVQEIKYNIIIHRLRMQLKERNIPQYYFKQIYHKNICKHEI